jgi:hypothetical protein
MDYVICFYTGYCNHQTLYILSLTVFAIPVSWIKTYTFLSYFVMIGLVIAFSGLFSMMGLCAANLIKDDPGCDPGNVSKGLCEIKTFDAI